MQDVKQVYFIKQILTGLHSEFYISKTSCHSKVKELSLSNYLPQIWMMKNWIYTFPKGISFM